MNNKQNYCTPIWKSRNCFKYFSQICYTCNKLFPFLAFSDIHSTQRVRNFWHSTIWQPSRARSCYTCNR